MTDRPAEPTTEILPEDADERRMFDQSAALYGSAAAWMRVSLILWSKLNPRGGSFSKTLAIMADEVAALSAAKEAAEKETDEIAELNAILVVDAEKLHKQCEELRRVLEHIALEATNTRERLKYDDHIVDPKNLLDWLVDCTRRALAATSPKEGCAVCGKTPAPHIGAKHEHLCSDCLSGIAD